MPLEIEAKMQVDDLGAVRSRLKAAGAKAAGTHLETNIFFDTPGAALRRADRGLRLRANREVKSKRTVHIVTFKGPRQSGRLKRREEIEFEVVHPDAAIRVFRELGFGVSLRFQKRRESWTLGGCKIELDELPLLGTFVEIEGPGNRRIMQVRKRLGLADHPLITGSYASLMAARVGKSRKTVEFPRR
jgi:adenylate cyclase, class 2